MDGWNVFALKYCELFTKSNENVLSLSLSFFISFAHMADTTLESTPPDKNVHIGTSDTI